jgi:hypothetical protein
LDHQSLVSLFRRIVLAGSPLLLGAAINLGCEGCPPDYNGNVTNTVPIAGAILTSDAGPPLSTDELIARCQYSKDLCTPLCVRAMPWLIASEIKSCKLTMADGGGLAVEVSYYRACVGGRCPEGLAPSVPRGAADPLGAWLAANAHLEAASIDAFEILATELGAHRAPPAFIQAARAAIADERRHADTVGRLATSRGAAPPAVQVSRGPVRNLETIARENAVEGCVRETYAALLAFRQALAATDPAIRRAMGGIARDEARHAALAWAVDGWSQPLLAPAARRRVREARHEAIEALVNAPLAGLSPEDRARAGLPDDDDAVRMAGELGARLV